ncbi:hypothetical protein BDQ17DRAFT_205889 [Cyathus striatus]|nr:hypothetical protein BDQ17DRAFT_205889 [Cyathus striatus]
MDNITDSNTENAANAQLASEAGAKIILQRRRDEFSQLNPSELIATACISAVAPLDSNSFGIVAVNYQLLRGKGGKHNWVSSSNNFAALSYIGLQVWQQVRPGHRHFHGIFGPAAHLTVSQFVHIPSAAFLCQISASSV